MWKRLLIPLFAAIVPATLAAGAGATTFPLTLADGLGGTITITRRPMRIVSLAPNVTEILFAIGAGERVVGVTRYCNYPPEATDRPNIGGYTDISVEAVLALAPDLVIASRGNPRRTLQTLSRHGLTVLAIGPQSVEEVQGAIRQIGRATDNRQQAERVCENMERVLASVRDVVAGVERRRRVYFGNLRAPYTAAGPSSFIGRCIALAGGENIARGASQPWFALSLEAIIERDPEVLVEGFHGGRGGADYQQQLLERLRADEVWAQTTAVRAGHVHVVNDDLVHRPGPRVAHAVAEMARLLYPERFSQGQQPEVASKVTAPSKTIRPQRTGGVLVIVVVGLLFLAATIAARHCVARTQRSLGGQIVALVILTVPVVVAAIVSLGFGHEPIGWQEISAILFGNAQEQGVKATHVTIIRDVRLPRIILALLVGGALAAAGMAMQALFQNPLADPYIVGVAPGAAVGATLALALGWEVGRLGAHALPVSAFAGSLAVSCLVYILASRFGKIPVLHLLLFGVALGALCMGITSLILMLSPLQIQEVYMWLLGGLWDTRWWKVSVVWPYLLAGVLVLYFFAREMDAFLLGEEEAQSLGIAVERLKRILLATATLLAATAVAVSGIIGFVGLIVPHMMRLVVGPRHRILLPASLLSGSVLLVLSDTLARSIRPPTEIPVGIVTTFLGVPFFVFLLSRKRRYIW